MIKIGLIGCGSVALASHLPAITATSGLSLHALYDPDPAHLARAIRKFPGAKGYSDLQAFFQSGLDVVTITSAAPAHMGNVMEAARHRLPVLCEKPLAMNRREGEAMIAAMYEAGVPLYTAFCYRFSPVALRIRHLVAQKAIGEVRSLRLIYNWDLHGKYAKGDDGLPIIQERRRGRMLEGGPMIDCGTHQIDLAQFWIGSEVERFTGHGAWVEDYESPDHLWLHLDYANGVHAVVEISYSYHQVSKRPRREFVYELIGTEGVIRYDRDQRSFTLDHREGREELPWSEEKNFEGMYEELVNALVRGSSDLLTAADQSLKITDIAWQATQEAIRNRRRSGTSPALVEREAVAGLPPLEVPEPLVENR